MLLYYFVRPRRLYLLPMPATRNWFLDRVGQFAERRVTTPVGPGAYTTIGRLVPIHQVMSTVREARCVEAGTELDHACWSLRRFCRQVWSRIA